MPITSPNIGLNLPEGGDVFNHDTFLKQNFEKIDTSLAQSATNVKSFGAKGDGVTDDTQAIQNALDSLVNGGKAFFPQGIYRITKPLNINYNNMIIEGNNATILVRIPHSFTIGINSERKKAAFNIIGSFSEDTGYSQVSGEYICKRPSTITDITADGTKINQVTLTDALPLNAGDIVRFSAYNQWIGRATKAEYQEVLSVSGSTVTFKTGLRYKYDGSPVSEYRNFTSKDPSALDFYTNNGLRPNVSTYPYMGLVKVTPRQNIIIRGLTIDKTGATNTFDTTNGINYGTNGIFLLGAVNCKVENCTLIECGIWNMDSQDNKFTGNKFKSVSSTVSVKNWFANGCSGVLVQDNEFSETLCIIEEGGRDVTVSGNKFVLNNFMESCIFVHTYAEDLLIENNVFLHKGNNAIDLSQVLGTIRVRGNSSFGYSIFLRYDNNNKMIFTPYLDIRNNLAEAKVNYTMIININKRSADPGDVKGVIIDNQFPNGTVAFGTDPAINIYIKNYESGLLNDKTDTSKLLPTKGSYYVGDCFLINGATYRCTVSGNFNRNITGLTANTTANSNIVSLNTTTDGISTLREGDVININGVAGRYKIVGVNGNNVQVVPNIPNAVTTSSCFVSGVPTFAKL